MPKQCFFNDEATRQGVETVIGNAIIIEDHVHNYERWFGASPGQTGPGLQNSLTGFRLTSSSTLNVFGSVVTILDGTETPTKTSMTKFDLHRLLLINVQNNSKTYRIRFANNSKGHANYAAAVAAGIYSDLCLRIDTAPVHGFPYEIKSERFPAGTIIWAAVATADSLAQWIDFMVAIHEYQT